MTARIEVPPAYTVAIVGPDPQNPIWQAPSGGFFEYLTAGYGGVTEGPPFVLRGARAVWLGPRPIALAFTLVIPPQPPPP